MDSRRIRQKCLLLLVACAASVGSAKADLLVTDQTNHSVLRFSNAGVPLGTFIPAGSGGQLIFTPVFGPDGNVYLVDQQGGILRYNGSTGAFIDKFVSAGSGGMLSTKYFIFGPDGNLYVSDNSAQVVRRFNGSTGAPMGVFTSGYNLVVPLDSAFGPDGNFYVADGVNVVKFDGTTGAFISVFVAAGSGGLSGPELIAFRPDGTLWVESGLSGIFRYDAQTGAFVSQFLPYFGVLVDGGLAFGPDGNVYVAYFNGGNPIDWVDAYDAQTGATIRQFVPPGAAGAIGGIAFTPNTFNDDFSRPDGVPGNGWSWWYCNTIGGSNISIVSGQLQTFGCPNLAGGIFRTLPLVFPVTFSFDFRTFNSGDGGWLAAVNNAPMTTISGTPGFSNAQMMFFQYAGTRNLSRGYNTASGMVYESAALQPGQRNFQSSQTAQISGTINVDLSSTITVRYHDGLIPDSTTVTFGPVAGLPPPLGSLFILGNSNASNGPHLFDNLVIASPSFPFGPYAATVVADHPVAYYRLDEPTGSTIAVDASGNGHNGVYEGNPLMGVTGLVQGPDTAVNFNTTGDVRIANSSDLNFVGTTFTIEAWVSGISSGGNLQRIFDKVVAGATLGYGLDISNTQIRLLGSTNLEPLASFSPTATYHIVGVSDGAGSGSIYVNGSLLASGQYFSSTAYTGDAHIAVANDGTAHFGGTIDEVAVYNYALPPDRVLAHYQTGIGTSANLLSLSISPSTVTAGQTSSGTITLVNPAPAGDAVVGLASSNTAIASVPTSISIPAGSTTGTFAVSTSAVTSDTVVNLFATYGLSTKSAVLTVKAPLLPKLTIAPSSVAFGGVSITTSSKQTITITSTGQGSLAVNSISIAGNFLTLANVPIFPLVLAPSATTSFDVIFAPASAIPSAGTVTITSDAPSSPTVLPVTGNGMAATPALNNLRSQTIAYGTATVTLSGSISAGNLIPPAGETVSITLNGVTQLARIQTNGTFSGNFTTSSLALGSYNVAYTYVGDGNFSPTADNATSVTIAVSSAQVTFTEYPVPTTGSLPEGITSGPDGNLWFTERLGDRIGRITTVGVITEFLIPTNGGHPFAIAAGPDGNLWFTEVTAGKVGRITIAGVITEFPIPTAAGEPFAIAAGPDGNLWFAEQAGDNIGKISTAGVITEYPIPTANSGASGISAGPDGNLWFAEETANRIGRITTSGLITEFSIPTAGGGPAGITAGPDGNLWFAENFGNKIGRISTAGVITEFLIPTTGSHPFGIAPGPDGNLWFAEESGNNIGRITTAGVITEFPVPSSASLPQSITTGPDGNLWFTEYGGNKIGTIRLLGSACMAPPSGMVGWWPADGNYNDITSGNNGTPIGGGVSFSSGEVGSAFSFNGASYVDVPSSSALEPPQVSVAAWVQSSSVGTYRYIVDKGVGPHGAEFALYTGGSGGLFFYISTATNDVLSPDAGTAIWDGGFHYVVGTFDGSTVRLFVDGTEVGSGTPINQPISYVASLPDFYIAGCCGDTSGAYNWRGAIDEIQVFNRALSPSEIKPIFAAGSAGECKSGLTPSNVLSIGGGNNQIGVVGQTLTSPLIVKVADASGNAVSGRPIAFAVTAGGGTLTGSVTQLTVNTDASGLASVTLNLGSTPGPNNVTATAVGLSGSPISFTETGQPQPSISVTPIPVAFGNVPILTSSNQTVTITSTGQGPLTINSISIAGSSFSLGSPPSFPVVLAPPGTVSFGVTFAPLATGPANATITITSNAQTSPTLVTVTGNGVPVTTSCVAAPTGLVSWWTGDGNIDDLLGANNPSASNAVSFVSGKVASAFTFGSGGYIEIPASASLANQQFTWSAWVRPDGPGPNNDFDGNWIVGQDIDNTNLSVYLSWRATDNRFSLTFGSQLPEQIVSQDAFAPGQFYFVAGSYDGSTFMLYVNGQIEATRSSVKTISYSSLTWTIGASSANIRAQGYPRTWNGVIDEVQAFSRALSQSEVQAIFNAGGLGECKPLGVAVAPSPVAFGNVAILTSSKITATITNAGQGSLAVNSITIAGANFTLGNLPTLPIVLAPSGTASFDVIFNPLSIVSSNATITITSNAATSPTVIQATGSGIAPPLPPATSITVGTDQAVYHRGQAVQISGTLTAAGNAGIPNITVNLQASLNGTSRTLAATTDATGTYHAVFQPAPNDGGAFSVTAVGTSGGSTQTASANFRILGLLLTPGSISQDLLMGSSVTLPFTLQNLGDAGLNSVTYSVTVTPAASLSVTPPQSQSSISSGASLTVPVTLTAPSGSPPPGTVRVLLNVSGTDLASGLTETNSAMIVVTLRSAVSMPVLLPSTASVGVNPGGTLMSTFTVRNDGFATINSATVTLQNAASLNWVALGGGSLGTIVPGDSRQFTIDISPPSSVAVGSYAVPFTVSGGATPLQGTLNISVTQLTMGSVSFVVNDDIGANVSGATVTLYGKTNGKTFQGVTDNTGLLTINGVNAGDYSFVVVANTHDPTNGVVTVTAGSTAQVNVILSYDVVTLSFLVTPTTIVDQYNVTLNVTYATTLPKPALQVVPCSLDFSFFPEDATNGRYACSLSITNTHPTAPVRNLALDATQLDVTQPVGQRLRVFFSNDLQTYQIGDLAGKGTVIVPCFAVIDGGTVPTHSVGNIAVQANYDFSLSGQVLQGTTTTNVPVTYTRPSDLTFSPIAFTYDMKTDPANPVLIYNGNGYVYDIKSNRVPGVALQKPAGAPFNGHNVVAFTETQGGTAVLDVINGNQGNAFWHGDFDSLKQSLTGLGDSTTYDISTLDCPTSPNCAQGGLTLPQALASQVAMSPNQVLFDPTYLAFEGQWADGTSPSPYLIPVRITTITPTSISTPRGPSGFGGSCDPTDPLYALCKDNFGGGGGGGGFLPAQGGQILIAIDQTIRLERQAFNAALGIGAKTTLSNVVASIQILDANGADASSNFFVLVTSDPFGATHGGTVAGQTVVSWQLIPNAGAGGQLPQGAQYRVKANLSYTAGGVARVASTQTVTITVMPSPKLTVAYTAPFVVVPGKDAKIRVTLKNIGYGTAHNLTIQSAQPRVAATLPANPLLDNPGPLVNFTVSGSSNTADGSGFLPGNLTISFGDVAPGATVSGYWTLQVSQRGYFIDISSTFSHSDFNGIALDPLIQPPTTTLVPAIAGTVTTDLGQAIPGLTVNVTQTGSSVIGSDQTDTSGVYSIQDLAAGSYLEEVQDLSGNVVGSKNIVVLGNQATDFIDFVITNYNPTLALVCVGSTLSGAAFTADGVSYAAPQCFPWTIGSSHTLSGSTTSSALSAKMIQPLAAPTALAAAATPAQTLVGWTDAETAATRTVTVTAFGATYTLYYRPTSDVNQYARGQVTTGIDDHKWPSTNTVGDLIWSQQLNGFWQVFMQGPHCVGGTNGICQITQDAHNHERPAISDNGTIAWFQDNTGGGLGYAIVRLDPGSTTPSIMEFSSRNVFCPTAQFPTSFFLGFPIFSTSINTGPCTYKDHAAGKTFGIGSDGRTISFYTFIDTGFPLRRFNVTGTGKLPVDSAPDDFYGYESPDINSQSDIVYANSFVPGVVSKTRYVWLATTSEPFRQTLIDQGQNPHLSERPANGADPDIVYIQSGVDVTRWPGADPSHWVALGLWADIAGTGSTATIVYECVVGGHSQICLAKPIHKFLVAVPPTSQSVLIGGQVRLTVKVNDSQGNPVGSTKITFSLSGRPTGAGGSLDSPLPNGACTVGCTVLTGPDGMASVRLIVGTMTGPYQVSAICTDNDCVPSSVGFTVVGAVNLTVTPTANQTAPICSVAPTSVVATVTDPAGNPWPNPIQVSFVLTPPAGTAGAALSMPGGITEPDGTISTQLTAGTKVGTYQVTASCPNQDCIPNSAVSITTAMENLAVTLVDPITGDPATTLLDLNGSKLSSDHNLLATQGRTVQGIAADGTAQLVLRISGACGTGGEQLNATIMSNMSTGISSSSIVDEGALGNPGSLPDRHILLLTADGTGDPVPATVSAGMAFVAYRAPVDFVRFETTDQNAIAEDLAAGHRDITVNVVSETNPSIHVPVTVSVVRPPVILVHGTWSNPDTWLHFGPLNPLNPDPRFDVFPVDYSSTETKGVVFNAPLILGQIRHNLDRFKALHNVAAVQSDLVAHSLGGLISRRLALVSNFLQPDNFMLGDVHKLITIDSPHFGTKLANNLVNGNPICKLVWAGFRHPVGQQLVDQMEPDQQNPQGSPLVAQLNANSAAVHILTHALVGQAGPVQIADAEGAFGTSAIATFCPSLLPVGGLTELYTSPINPAAENDVIVGAASQAGLGLSPQLVQLSSSVAGLLRITQFPNFSLVHTIVPLVIPTGPDVMNRVLNYGFITAQATPTVPTVAEVIRLLNSSVKSANFAAIKP